MQAFPIYGIYELVGVNKWPYKSRSNVIFNVGNKPGVYRNSFGARTESTTVKVHIQSDYPCTNLSVMHYCICL